MSVPKKIYNDNLISIIVPIYNSESSLKYCIESITKQTYENIELILVDDGSTDKSGMLCDYYASIEDYIRVIHQNNQGVSTARNVGIKNSNGKYIQFVDSDDYLDPTMCEKLIKALIENRADLSVCGFKTILNHGIKYTIYQTTSYQNLKDLENDFPFLYKNCFFNSPWNKLYRRELINTSFDSSISLGEDLLFNLRYFRNCKSIIVLKEPLYNYICKNDSSLSMKFRKDKFEIATVLFMEVEKFYRQEIQGVNNGIIYSVYLESVFYYIQDLVYFQEINIDEKLGRISKLIYCTYLQTANERASEKSLQVRMISLLIRRKNIKMVICFFYLKKILSKIMR